MQGEGVTFSEKLNRNITERKCALNQDALSCNSEEGGVGNTEENNRSQVQTERRKRERNQPPQDKTGRGVGGNFGPKRREKGMRVNAKKHKNEASVQKIVFNP